MEELTLRKAQLLAKKIYVHLVEVQDISKQLAEALDRNDQVTARMLIGMRNEPINSAQKAKQALGALRNDLEPEEALRLTELLNGAEPLTEQERPLAVQMKSNEQLLRQTLALDEILNRKIARDKSIYPK
jgi:hypothetical protein